MDSEVEVVDSGEETEVDLAVVVEAVVSLLEVVEDSRVEVVDEEASGVDMMPVLLMRCLVGHTNTACTVLVIADSLSLLPDFLHHPHKFLVNHYSFTYTLQRISTLNVHHHACSPYDTIYPQ